MLMNVTIFGLGLHGGGTGAARYFASRGHSVTVTDLRDRTVLAPSIDSLNDLEGITYVLGYHRLADFEQSDLVVKNTAVPWDHPMLLHAERIETDLSWFLSHNTRPLTAVTGTKGKTTVCCLLQHLLLPSFPGTAVAGNMGISLFSLLDHSSSDPVIAELSSWQLRDLRMLGKSIRPDIALLTSLFPDHMNTYDSYQSYINDKQYLFSFSPKTGILPEQTAQHLFPDTSLHQLRFGPSVTKAGITRKNDRLEILDAAGRTIEQFPLPRCGAGIGEDTLLSSMLAAWTMKADPASLAGRAESFPGVPHRMELVRSFSGISWYNDSASTVPESVLRAVESLEGLPVHLITGGTDKGLSPDLFERIFSLTASVHLLSGGFTERIIKQAGKGFYGPFCTMEEAVASAYRSAVSAGGAVLLSPGASSFECFLHETDRGNHFVNAVKTLYRSSRGRG